MASILSNSITFSDYSTTDLMAGNGGPYVYAMRHLLGDRFEYWADDKLAHCYAALDFTGTITTNNLTLTLKNSVNTTLDTKVYNNVPTNRMSWLVDISDLASDTYTVTAVLSTRLDAPQTFTFTKSNSKSQTAIVFPNNGLQIYPMTQAFLSNTSYPTHAAVPIPYNTLLSTDKLGLFEDSVRIPCQIEIIDTWDKGNGPKWLHVHFNAKYTSGNPSVYLLKIVSDSNPATGMTVVDDTPIYTISVNISNNVWTAVGSLRWTTGQPIKFNTSDTLPKAVTPAFPPVFDGNYIYYARVLSDSTFTVHCTAEDAQKNTNIIKFTDTGSGSHSVISVGTWYVQGACQPGLYANNNTWGNNIPHGFSNGQLVRYAIPLGAATVSTDTILSPNKVYTISVVNSTQFILFYNGVEVDLQGTSSIYNGQPTLRNFYAVSTITVDNKTIKFQIQRPFAGITKVWYDSTGTSTYGNPIVDAAVNGISGPYVQDHRNIDWYATHDYTGQINIEESGTNQVCIRAEGWYQSYAKTITPFCRYIDRIYLNAAQNLIKVQQASIIADNTYQAKIGDMSFILPLITGGVCSFGADNGSTINDNSLLISSINTSTDFFTTSTNHGWVTGQQVVLATTGTLPTCNPALVENKVYYLRKITNNQFRLHATLIDAQQGVNFYDIASAGTGNTYIQDAANNSFCHQQSAVACRYLGSTTGTGGKSDGWFNIKGSGVQTTLLAKDFWQKFPKEVELNRSRLTYHQWPSNGTRTFTTAYETTVKQVSNFQCFHQGKFLDLQVPSDYFQFMAQNNPSETTECNPRDAVCSSGDGLAIYNEFAFLFNPIASAVDNLNQAKLYQADPIAMPSTQWCAQSQVFGSIAEAGNDWPQVEEYVDNMIPSFLNAERMDTYGIFNYGDGHHTWIPREDRAGWHRLWYNNHYYSATTVWLLFLRGQKKTMLDCARMHTDHLVSIDEVRYDGFRGYSTGYNTRIEGVPANAAHMPGAFWHCKAILHWGSPAYGQPNYDSHSGVYGHWVDPTGALWAWIIDGNRWAKDGYELWYQTIRINTSLPTRGFARDPRMALGVAQWTYKYYKDPSLLPYLHGLARGVTPPPTSDSWEGQNVAPFSIAVTNATDSSGTWTAPNNLNWRVTDPARNYSYNITIWRTPRLVRLTTTGILPTVASGPALDTSSYYWASTTYTTDQTITSDHKAPYVGTNGSIVTLTFGLKLYPYDKKEDCIQGLNTFITYTNQGTGNHSVWSGEVVDSNAGPVWYGPLALLWYEDTRDPTYPEWIRDNDGYLFYEAAFNMSMSAATYDITNNNIALTKWMKALYWATDRALYREPGTKYDYYGAGPGEIEQNGDQWLCHQWPYFLNRLRKAGITGFNNNDIEYGTYFQGASRYNNYLDGNRGASVMVAHNTSNGAIDVEVKSHPIGNDDLAQGTLLIILNPYTRNYASYGFTNKTYLIAGGIAGVDVTANTITLSVGADWFTGQQVYFTSTLTTPSPLLAGSYNSNLYYIRVITPPKVFKVYSTLNDALNDTNAIDLVGVGAGTRNVVANNNYYQGVPGTYQLGDIWKFENWSPYPVTTDTVLSERTGQWTSQALKRINSTAYANTPAYNDNTQGLYRFQFNGGGYAIYQNISNQNETEAQVLHNYYSATIGGSYPTDTINNYTYISKGYLVPIIKNPMRIVVKTVAILNATYGNPNRPLAVKIVDATGHVITDSWWLEGRSQGDTFTCIMQDRQGTLYPTPWYIEVIGFAPGTAVLQIFALDPTTQVTIITPSLTLDDAVVFHKDLNNAIAIAGLLTNTWIGIGNISLGGTALIRSTFYKATASGGLVVAGDAGEVLKLAYYHWAATGGLYLGGSLGEGYYIFNWVPLGGFELAGEALFSLRESTITEATLAQQRTECENIGNFWCAPNAKCVDNTVYHDGVITSITSCTYPDEVKKLLNEDPTVR